MIDSAISITFRWCTVKDELLLYDAMTGNGLIIKYQLLKQRKQDDMTIL